IWGALCSAVLIVFPAPLFRIFIPEASILPMGIDYLMILGVSQLFMCLEGIASGAFSGFGKTLPPSVVGVVLTAARIPAAMWLSNTALGLNGIWWSITLSSVLKGVVLVFLFRLFERRIQKGRAE